MTDYIRFPFGVTGDLTTVPDLTQMDGSVSFQEGWGEEYSQNLISDPDARAVEREKFNYIMNRVTAAIRYIQINSLPEYIPASENGGTAIAYAAGTRVRYDDGSGYKIYAARTNGVTSLPTVSGDWVVIDPVSGAGAASIGNAQIAPGASIDASKIANGSVSNAEFQYLDGVSSAIQTQLNGKQPTGNYITSLTGDVTASGAGAAAATLATSGVVPGTYNNANVTVDAKGRVTLAANGASPFGILEGFETWNSGLPTGLPWTSPSLVNISESSSHVTQGFKSLAFSGTAEINATGLDLTAYGEILLDVYVGTAPAGSYVSLTCGANTVQTTTATTGIYKLRCPVASGATTISIKSVSGSVAWVDNLTYSISFGVPDGNKGDITTADNVWSINNDRITTAMLKNATVLDVLRAAYPVGSIYINAAVNTNPATLLGFGTWVAFATGRMVIGVDTGDSDFNTVQKTGGNKSIALTTNELPPHSHSGSTNSSGAHTHTVPQHTNVGTNYGVVQNANYTGELPTSSSGAHTHTVTTNSVGNGAAFSLLNPYITAFLWRRTA